MPSPRVLQAQLQDILESVKGDTRMTGVAEALEGALGTLHADNAPPPSPGQRAAGGDDPEARPYHRSVEDERNDGSPKSFHEARDAAVTAMSEANAG